MKRFFSIFIFTLLIVFIVNVYVDPAHLLKKGELQSDELKIAQILLEGKQAVVQKERIGFDERVARKIYLEHKNAHDSSVIFGSSRVRYFSAAAFNDKLHFVDALNATTLEDILVLSYIRDKAQLIPNRVVISLDPWMIEKKNDYTRLVQNSYAEDFVKAVDNFKPTLPEMSSIIYKNMSAKTQQLVAVPFELHSEKAQTKDNFQEYIVGRSTITGTVLVSFDAKIKQGTYNWAWHILVNGAVKDAGNYMDNIQGSPSPHEYRTMITTNIDVKQGDAISLELAHADNNGKSVPMGSQQYYVQNFSVNLKCSDPNSAAFKTWLTCDGILQPQRIKNYSLIVKELFSPAYFQESIKNILLTKHGTEHNFITAKQDCIPENKNSAYVFCSDGSVPWPRREEYNSSVVESIVRTIDDGLVPLKNVDENALKLLNQITDFYISKGTQVKYVLVPVHPYSYNKWASEGDSRGFIKAEAVYKEFAKKHGIRIYGSYDSKVVGCDNTDFRDWVHPLPRCTNKIAQEIIR
jgi:hypothetical protein